MAARISKYDITEIPRPEKNSQILLIEHGPLEKGNKKGTLLHT